MNDNIRVAIRVRPLISRESQRDTTVYWDVTNSQCISQVPPGSDKFRFDRVFDSADDNSTVYNELCWPIVQSTMQGFNGTVFAYGQTSSGKTFTMMGEHNGITKGLIQYTVEDVFNIIQTMPEREFLLRVSFLEIYNEKVFDLLSEKNDDLKLLEDSYGIVNVNGLKEEIVQTSDQIWEYIYKCQKKRRTGETQMNRASSRSHFIFRMIIESRLKDEEDSVVNVSQLNLVDLAGSENVKQTKSKGERFKEGIHINLSLSTLCQVISLLSEKKEDQFINFRNSKLTRLLQNSLGGNALTAIICTVTPASLKETLSSLKFATRAKIIKNKPKKNEILTDQALLKQYANRIKKLSEQLEVSKLQGKELEEKTKQNEDLKKQIEALKANFVSQTVINKAKTVRRETWGGSLDARSFSFTFGLPRNTFSSELAIVEEEPEGDTVDFVDAFAEPVRKKKSKGLSVTFRDSVSRKVLNAETQTDLDDPEQNSSLEEAMLLVSDLKNQLTTLQNEYMELNEYTTLEKQHFKAENELRTELELLRRENCTLREELETLRKTSSVDSSKSAPEVNDEISIKNEEFDPDPRKSDEVQNSRFLNHLNDSLLSNYKHTPHRKIRELDISGSTLLDESLRSNMLAFYDECLENEVVSELKSEVESLKYDIELKDKQINLLNDKLQITEQMILSLKAEINLGLNIESKKKEDIADSSEKVSMHVTCQTDVVHSPMRSMYAKECQTSPLKLYDSANIDAIKWDKLSDLNGSLLNSERSSNFGSTVGNFSILEEMADSTSEHKKIINANPEIPPLKSAIDTQQRIQCVMENQSTQVTPKKYEGISIQCYQNETDEHSVQTSPIKSLESILENFNGEKYKIDQGTQITDSFGLIENQSTQVTPKKFEQISVQCHQNETEEHFVQTSPIKNLELISGNFNDEKHKTDQSTQMTDSFTEDDCKKSSDGDNKGPDSFVNQSAQTLPPLFNDTEVKSSVESSTVVHSNNSLTASVCDNVGNVSTVLKVEDKLLQNCSDEMKTFIKQLNELKAFTMELMKKSLKAEYLEDMDDCRSEVEDCSSKSVDTQITDLKNLITRFEFCFKEKEEACEIYNSQLDSKFDEIVSLKMKLSEAEEISREKEDQLSTLNKKIFSLHESISELAFMREIFKKVNSEEKLNSLNKSTDMFLSEFSKSEHDLILMENLVVRLNSHLEENVSKITILTENLKKVEGELVVLKEKNAKVCDNVFNLVSVGIQTKDIINTNNTIQQEREVMQLKSQIENLQETNCQLEQNIKDLKQKITDLEESHSAKIGTMEMEFLESKFEWERKTRELVRDLEDKYYKELLDQQRELTEELHGKIQEQKEEHLKQVDELKKEFLDVKVEFEKQIRDLEEQLFSESSEKENLKDQFERENKEITQAYQVKFGDLRNKYNNKILQYQEAIRELRVKLQHYSEETEKMKKKDGEVSDERYLWRRQYAEQDKENKKEINYLKNKLAKMTNKLELKQNVCSGNCKEVEECNKVLMYDLDQRKAKIMSLEANNASLIQEIKKLKEMLSSKAVLSDRCRTNSRDCKTENQDKTEDHKEKQNNNLEQRNVLGTMTENLVTKQGLIHDDECQKDNDDPNVQTPKEVNPLLIGGGSGSANMVKCYWLENAIHKKDKEISKLKKELNELKSEIKQLKIESVRPKETKAETGPETKKQPEIKRISPLHESNEDVTVQTKDSHPYYGRIMPKAPRKHTSKERISQSTPQEQPKKEPLHVKEDAAALHWQYPTSNLKENKIPKKTENIKSGAMDVLTAEECKQQ